MRGISDKVSVRRGVESERGGKRPPSHDHSTKTLRLEWMEICTGVSQA